MSTIPKKWLRLHYEGRNTFNLNLKLLLPAAVWERVLLQIGCTLEDRLFLKRAAATCNACLSNCVRNLLEITYLLSARYWLVTVRAVLLLGLNLISRKTFFFIAMKKHAKGFNWWITIGILRNLPIFRQDNWINWLPTGDIKGSCLFTRYSS